MAQVAPCRYQALLQPVYPPAASKDASQVHARINEANRTSGRF